MIVDCENTIATLTAHARTIDNQRTLFRLIIEYPLIGLEDLGNESQSIPLTAYFTIFIFEEVLTV